MLLHPDHAVVTGAFGCTGRYISWCLLDLGDEVRKLTRNSVRSDPCAGKVKAHHLEFSDPEGLRRTMEGTGVLYRSYGIRYPRRASPSTTPSGTPGSCFRPPSQRASAGSSTSPVNGTPLQLVVLVVKI